MESVEGKERQGAKNHTPTMANFQKHGLPVSLFSKNGPSSSLSLSRLSLPCLFVTVQLVLPVTLVAFIPLTERIGL